MIRIVTAQAFLGTFLIVLVFPGSIATHPSVASRGETVRIKLIAFNDYHGNLQSPGSFGQNTSVPPEQRPVVGGAEYIGAHVSRLKRQNPLNVVVGSGDFVSASPLVSALFHDEPAVETLNHIGVEFTAVGNHEFDRGPAELLRLQNGGCRITSGAKDPNTCQGERVGTPVPFEGARFQWLSANVIDTASGKPLLAAYGVKEFDGVQVAFIGLTLRGTPGIVTPSAVAGLEFRDEAGTVNALVPQLRQRGIEAIVVLMHQGGLQTRGVSDINGCDGNLGGSEIAAIVSHLDDAVDLVVSGHTHAAYNCSPSTVDVRAADGNLTTTRRPTGVTNVAGRLVPVTSASAFGRVLSDIDLALDRRSGDVTDVAVTNRLVDQSDPEIRAAIVADPTLADIVAAYSAIVSPIADKIIGSIRTELGNGQDAAGNMPAGELVADAQLAATAAAKLGGAVVAFINPGGVRTPGFTYRSSAAGEGGGNVTHGEAFSVQPFGNSLLTVTLTGQHLKNALEQQFAGCRGQTTTRILLPSRGLKYAWDASKGCDERIVDVRLVDATGAVVDQIVDSRGVVNASGKKTYRVTLNSFLVAGADGFTSFGAATGALGGVQDIDALIAYLAGFKKPNAAYDPASVESLKPRIVRVN